MVYTSQAATHGGHPLHLEIVRRLRESDAAGATSLRGVWGFHGDHAPHGDRLLQLRRHVPVVTTAIDTPERTARSFEIIDELTREHGLVTSEMVPAFARSAPGRGAAGPSWQRTGTDATARRGDGSRTLQGCCGGSRSGLFLVAAGERCRGATRRPRLSTTEVRHDHASR